MVYSAAYYPAKLQKNLKGDKFQGINHVYNL